MCAHFNFRSLEQQILEIKQEVEIQKRPQLDSKNRIEELSRQLSEKKAQLKQVQTTIQARVTDKTSLERDISASNEKLVFFLQYCWN